MPRKPFLQLPLAGKVFLCLLAIVYLATLFPLVKFLYFRDTVVEHTLNANVESVLKHWTPTAMRNAEDADLLIASAPDLTQESVNADVSKANKQEGQPPRGGESAYPLSTVGKVFFTNESGQDMVCSGTAVRSQNRSVVDSAGHCFYWNGGWVKNVIFCPLYENGNTPYGCWAARELLVPEGWINARPNDLHQDFGIAVVSPNNQGALTDLVGGAGWAYNQPVKQPFFAYGYPAAYPFDGQTRKSCEGSTGTSWQHGGGTVVSIPCNMTGGSSGGPWFIKDGDKWYLNGHNDFTSSMRPGHMFSPYYDDVWYKLYEQAQKM